MIWGKCENGNCESIRSSWLFRSIIVFNRLSGSLPLEIRSVILLRVPSWSWVHDIVSPAHCFGITDGIVKSWEANGDIGEGVMGAPWLCHEITLMVSPASETNFPTDSIKFVRRMAVQMLLLLHVDAGNFVTLFLFFPWGRPGGSSPTSFYVEFLSFVRADTFGVCFGEM